MREKKWSVRVIIAWILILIMLALLVILVDPWQHYHKALAGIQYRGENQLYTNNGRLRTADYNALIIGTSMTSGFNEDEASELFGEQFIRTTFLGEGFLVQNENLKTAFANQGKLKHVIRSIDPIWFVTDAGWTGADGYPEYLYNEDPFDDVKYIYNLDMWHDAMIPTILATIADKDKAEESDGTEADAKDYLTDEKALDHYVRSEKQTEPIDSAETDEYFAMMDRNFSENILSTIEENPDVRFDLFFPPYSILWWDSVNQSGPGRVSRRIDMEEYAINKILAYDNVHLYSLNNDFDLIQNLDNYSDEIHYHPNVNSLILQRMHDGLNEITKDNYTEYLDELRGFYISYDYDALFDY